MPYFNPALQVVIERRYGGKQTALAAASEMPQSDISKLLRDEAPLSAAKLEKLINAQGMTSSDVQLLSHAAIRDFVGDDIYRDHFIEATPEAHLREDIGGASFQSLFPLSPRAEQVLRYIIAHAHEPDTTTALELLVKFLELPPPEPETPLRQVSPTHLRMVEQAEQGKRTRDTDKR